MRKILLFVFTIAGLYSCTTQHFKLAYTSNSESIPYSQAISANGLIYTSGQLGINPGTKLLGSDLESQTIQIMENLKALLEQNHSDFNHLVKVHIYLTDVSQLPLVNKIYLGYLPENKPARTTIQVAALPQNALIEIDCVAVMK